MFPWRRSMMWAWPMMMTPWRPMLVSFRRRRRPRWLFPWQHSTWVVCRDLQRRCTSRRCQLRRCSGRYRPWSRSHGENRGRWHGWSYNHTSCQAKHHQSMRKCTIHAWTTCSTQVLPCNMALICLFWLFVTYCPKLHYCSLNVLSKNIWTPTFKEPKSTSL